MNKKIFLGTLIALNTALAQMDPGSVPKAVIEAMEDCGRKYGIVVNPKLRNERRLGHFNETEIAKLKACMQSKNVKMPGGPRGHR